MSWICPYQDKDNKCSMLRKKCVVMQKGCALSGKVKKMPKPVATRTRS